LREVEGSEGARMRGVATREGVPRKPREEIVDGVAHVWMRGNDRREVFADAEDRMRWLSILEGVVEACDWRVLAYCQMTNHAHLVVETPKANLGAGMCRLNGLYARTFNRRHQRTDHLFGKPYGMTRIAEPEHLWFAAAYVALNPVRAGMCRRPEDWMWSSYAATVEDGGLRVVPPWWLDVRRLLSYFDGLGGDPRRRYADLVQAIGRLDPEADGSEHAPGAAASARRTA
jgi:putative transposase